MEADAKTRDWTFLQLHLQVHDSLDPMPAQSQDIQVWNQCFDREPFWNNHFILRSVWPPGEEFQNFGMSSYCLLVGAPASCLGIHGLICQVSLFECKGIAGGRGFFNTIWPLSLLSPRRTHMMGSEYLCLNARVSLVGGCSPCQPNELTIRLLTLQTEPTRLR